MKILIVKLSSLGDVVHTLPVLQDIHAALPGAQIDWVVEKSFAPLLSPLLLPLIPLPASGRLHRIIPCEIRRWRKSPVAAATRREWRAFRAELQREAYDAVIDLQGLTKSALVARLARLAPGGKRYALANQTDGSGYEAPTRWVADVAIHIAPRTAAVARSRLLVAQALGYTPQATPDFGLKVALAQQPRAQAAPENIADTDTAVDNPAENPAPGVVAFVHGTSRADKEWPLAHWVALGQRLNAAGYRIALPHGSARELRTSQAIAAALNGDAAPTGGAAGVPPVAVVWPLLPLDALTQALAPCAGVIGVDSGVSHIAVALDLPHVQIYNFDTAWRTGPAPAAPAAGCRQVSVFAQPTPSVDAVWQAWLACLAAGDAGGASAP